MKQRFGLKIGDIILMTVVLLSAVLLFLSPLLFNESQYAEIVIVEEDKIISVNLNKDDIYPIESRGVKLTVCVAAGEIFVKKSNCRDGICKNTPPISRVGQSIVCAKAGVVVRIVGEGAVVDGISG